MKESLLDKVASLAGKENIAMPEVIEKGVSNPRIDPGVMNFIMLASIASQAVKIRREIEQHNRKESFEGKLDSRILNATSKSQYLELLDRGPPYVPWISAFLINDGPDAVYIRVNRSEEIKMEVGETRTLDHTHADERIEQIYYKCEAGGTASIRVEGLY